MISCRCSYFLSLRLTGASGMKSLAQRGSRAWATSSKLGTAQLRVAVDAKVNDTAHAGPSTGSVLNRRPISTSTARQLPRSNRPSSLPSTPDPPAHSTLREAAVQLSSPERSQAAVPSYLRNLQNHLFTSFLPVNQPCDAVSPSSKGGEAPEMFVEGMPGPFGKAVVLPMPPTMRPKPDNADGPLAEPVLALVTPYEGGDCYISAALEQVAATVDSDVQRIDLALALGYQGASAPVPGAPTLPRNPLRDQMNRATGQSSQDGGMPMEMEEAEDDEEGPRIGVMRLPFMPHQQSQPTPSVHPEWVEYFGKLLASESRRRTIVHLESCCAMSPTFATWYPSFLEAVHRRRRGAHFGKQKKKNELLFPTTVVLSCSPSLLPTHTASAPAPADHVRSMLESVAARLGGKVSADRDSDPLWWGGDEVDVEGREQREEARVEALNEKG